MLETLKKHVTKNLIWRIVISVIIIGAVFFFSGKSILMFLKGPEPITAGMDYDDAEGSYVSFDARYIVDEYVRQTERNTDTKKETLKNISYFVYFEEDGYFFGIEVPSSKEDEMNQYIDDTISWLNGEVEELTQTGQGNMDKAYRQAASVLPGTDYRRSRRRIPRDCPSILYRFE